MSPKKKQSVSKSATAIKTRQQPSRRAKGTNRIPLEIRPNDDVLDNKVDGPDESNNNEIIIPNETNPVEESITNANTTDLNSNRQLESKAETDLDSTRNREFNNLNGHTEQNQLTDVPEPTTISDAVSVQTKNSDERQANDQIESNIIKLGLVSDNVTANQVLAHKSQVVITTAIITDHNQNLNTSPLRENGDKTSDIQTL